ncbi:MAG: 4-carboxymuconolactone decarboxylase, partial [Proteobacteria bacterium]
MTMKHLSVAVLLVSVLVACGGTAATPASSPAVPTLEEMRAVSPALEQYTQRTLLGGLWKRPELSPRDRSLVTLSVLIARGQMVELPL